MEQRTVKTKVQKERRLRKTHKTQTNTTRKPKVDQNTLRCAVKCQVCGKGVKNEVTIKTKSKLSRYDPFSSRTKHSKNKRQNSVVKKHMKMRKTTRAQNKKGTMFSFDWPFQTRRARLGSSTGKPVGQILTDVIERPATNRVANPQQSIPPSTSQSRGVSEERLDG